MHMKYAPASDAMQHSTTHTYTPILTHSLLDFSYFVYDFTYFPTVCIFLIWLPSRVFHFTPILVLLTEFHVCASHSPFICLAALRSLQLRLTLIFATWFCNVQAKCRNNQNKCKKYLKLDFRGNLQCELFNYTNRKINCNYKHLLNYSKNKQLLHAAKQQTVKSVAYICSACRYRHIRPMVAWCLLSAVTLCVARICIIKSDRLSGT